VHETGKKRKEGCTLGKKEEEKKRMRRRRKKGGWSLVTRATIVCNQCAVSQHDNTFMCAMLVHAHEPPGFYMHASCEAPTAIATKL